KHVPKEVNMALNSGKLIIPIVTEKNANGNLDLPRNLRYLLTDVHCFDLAADGLAPLVDAIEENFLNLDNDDASGEGEGPRARAYRQPYKEREPVYLPHSRDITLYRLHDEVREKAAAVYVPSVSLPDAVQKLKQFHFVCL